MAAPTIIDFAGSSTASTTNTFDIDVPAGVQNGDILLAAIRHQPNISANDISNPDFVRVGPAYPGSNDDGRMTGFFVHNVTDADSEPSSYTFSKPSGSPGRWACVMMIVRPEEGYEVTVDAFSPEYSGVAGTDRATSGYDITDGAEGIEIMLGASEFVAGNDHALVSTPSGFTTIHQETSPGLVGSVSRTTIWVGQRTAPDPAGGTSVNFEGTAVAATAQSIVLVQTLAAPPTGHPVKVWDGANEVDAEVWVYNGTEEVPAQDVLALPHRGYTIAQMEADIANEAMVYWAHRGGSVNFSEMTMRAYTNAIWHGAKVLEFSARRTSDGVWVGMHDNSVDRTTALSGNVSSFTWSELQGIAVDTPTTDGGTISRIEDLIAAYSDFVLMFDDKGNVFQSEFLALLKTVPDWQDHVIVKLDGEFTPSMAAAAKAEGFKTCAYFYDDAVDTHLPAIEANVDYIGLNYDADNEYWTTALSYGKPVWGHVVLNTTHAATAVSKGASILQCGNVLTIIPKYNDLP